jgi:hypothetical protein
LPPGIEIRTLLFYRWLYPRTKYKSRRWNELNATQKLT